MSYMLVLYFMGVHVVYDLPSRAECNSQASMLAQLLHYRDTGTWSGMPGYDYDCSRQTPFGIELAVIKERRQ